MKGVDTLHIKPATKAYNKIDTLGFSHLTTLDIGQIVPLLVIETIGGGKYNVPSHHFMRTAPLVKPTYGNFSFRTVAGFVPFTQVAFDAEAFIDGKTAFEGVTPKSRNIPMTVFCKYVTGVGLNPSYNIMAAGTSTDYDATIVSATGVRYYRKFTTYGKYVYKVLNSLGYTLPQNIDLQSTSSWFTTVGRWSLCAYPLLCFAKLYNDYMSQSQRFNSSVLTNFLRCVKYDITTTGYTNGLIDEAGLDIIFSNIKLCYENDYFTSCWQNPNSPLYTSESLNSVEIPSAASNSIVNNTTNDVNLQSSVSMISATDHRIYVQQRAIDMLREFDNWVRRNNYVGSRVVQQVYARFGIKPDDYRSHYAHIINITKSPVQVGDVTAMASSTTEVLGDYAGKAIVSDDLNFNYVATDRGMLFLLGYITVKPMNPYGFDRTVLRSKPFDFYTPEFDGLGANAVSYGELFANPKVDGSGDTSIDNVVFGFTERYNEYRFGRDKITGEFRKFDNNADDNTWHTGRLLTNVRAAGEMIAQSSAMNTMPQYDSEFNRIFAQTTGVDHFYLVSRFDITAMLPILSPNQVPDLGEGDTVVAKNGNEIN